MLELSLSFPRSNKFKTIYVGTESEQIQGQHSLSTVSQSTTIGPRGTVTFIKASSFGDAIALQRTDRVFVSSSEHRDSFS